VAPRRQAAIATRWLCEFWTGDGVVSSVQRLFIAADVPSTVRVSLDEAAQRAAMYWPAAAVRWTPAADRHLTLRFLGDTSPELVPGLTAAMDDVALTVAPLPLCLHTPGTFPADSPPRVLWMGLRPDAGQAALMQLQQHLEHRVQHLGYEAEARPYRPHITLGRVRRGAHQPASDWHQAASPMVFRVQEILLVRSERHETGARYTTMHRARLRGT
jgi:RNA 2',3'-cyclic 3'-phosphodiesterase